MYSFIVLSSLYILKYKTIIFMELNMFSSTYLEKDTNKNTTRTFQATNNPNHISDFIPVIAFMN